VYGELIDSVLVHFFVITLCRINSWVITGAPSDCRNDRRLSQNPVFRSV